MANDRTDSRRNSRSWSKEANGILTSIFGPESTSLIIKNFYSFEELNFGVELSTCALDEEVLKKLESIIKLCHLIQEEQFDDSYQHQGNQYALYEQIQGEFIHSNGEEFKVLLFDADLLHTRTTTIPVTDITELYNDPARLFRSAIQFHEKYIVVGHNSLSHGSASPRDIDKQTAERLIEVGAAFGIKLLDYMIVGNHSKACPKGYSSILDLISPDDNLHASPHGSNEL